MCDKNMSFPIIEQVQSVFVFQSHLWRCGVLQVVFMQCCHTQTEAVCLSTGRFTVENAPCLEDFQFPASLTDSLPRPFPSLFISPFCFTQLQLALITCLLGHTLPPTLLATPVPTAPSFPSDTEKAECCCMCSSCVCYLSHVSELLLVLQWTDPDLVQT